VEVHAELDSLIKDELRVVRLVDIGQSARLDELLLVVDGGVNDSITDCFSNNMFSLFTSLKHELDPDVVNRNLRVRDVDLL
jgi:hypothetical protein